jgi:hypothetical protein
MTENEFIFWLSGYLEGVSHDAQKPNPVIQTILDKIKLVKHTKSMETSKKITIDPTKVIDVPVENPFKDNKWKNPYTVTFDSPDEVPYGEICGCNPKNGGSGICGCVMGNKMVPNPKKHSTITYISTTTDGIIDKQILKG